METNTNHPMDTTTCNKPNLNLHNLIANLKHKIATVVTETCAMFHQQTIPKPNAHPMQMSVT